MYRVIVPTLNAAPDWPEFSRGLLSAVQASRVTILDSSSSDATQELARAAHFDVHELARSEFNHGGTRQLGVKLAGDSDVLIFLTQDAVLAAPDSVERLLKAFDDPRVAAAYGRQLPRPEARGIEAHARLFNYPGDSDVRDLGSRDNLGLRCAFLSNSFAAYRREALLRVGGFPSTVIFGEDTVTAARLLVDGWKIAYVADACVYHSHAYSLQKEFKRYFDVGVLHRREPWLLETFGTAGGEGKRFIVSELKFLVHKDAMLIPSALLRTMLKLIGYGLGGLEDRLGFRLKLLLSMHRNFWIQERRTLRLVSPARETSIK